MDSNSRLEGDTGNLVIGLQAYADELEGCGPIADDGDFGPATLKAVKCMQTDVHVTADGSVGPLTWGAMQADLSKTTTSGGWVYYGVFTGAKQFLREHEHGRLELLGHQHRHLG